MMISATRNITQNYTYHKLNKITSTEATSFLTLHRHCPEERPPWIAKAQSLPVVAEDVIRIEANLVCRD